MPACNKTLPASLFPESADATDASEEAARQLSNSYNAVNAHTATETPRKGEPLPKQSERAGRAVMSGKRHSSKSLLVAFQERTQIETLPLPFRMTLQVKTKSEANSREFWAARVRRKREQHQRVIDTLRALDVFERAPLPPVRITLTRHGRKMDGDNLQNSLKAVRDTIAAWMGVDDGSEAIIWEYRQTKGEGKVLIEFEPIGGSR